jgi:uncharacterized damage-inducible protein DinB
MSIETVRSLHGYNEWAMERVLDCAEALSDDQFVAGDDTPWGSIRNQFVHLIVVHWRWLCWADGSMSGDEAYELRLDPANFPDVSSVRAKWIEVRDQNRRYLECTDEEELRRVLSAEQNGDEPFSISVRDLLIHIANHSMQHRTEATMSLTRFGQSPGDLDYLFYALEQA